MKQNKEPKVDSYIYIYIVNWFWQYQKGSATKDKSNNKSDVYM